MISNIIPSVSRDIPSVILVAGLQEPEGVAPGISTALTHDSRRTVFICS